MKMELNRLAEHLARTSFQLEMVYHGVREAGLRTAEQTSPFPGFVFVLRGRAEFIFDGISYLAEPGNVLHGGAQMTLECRVAAHAPLEYLLVLYRIEGEEPEEFSLPDSVFEVRTGHSPRLTELLLRLQKTAGQPGGLQMFQAKTLFGSVLEEMLVCAFQKAASGSRALFEQMSAYLREHYSEEITIASLAEQSGVNRNRITYVFRRYAGMGPGEYLLRCRMERAREMLLADSVTVREVALAVGFSDPLYFSRIFKKHFAMSPSDFRKKFAHTRKFINNPC
ncbi:MAG: AraC family transcriptional regulator [Eubacteriales bacterium]|nr:AraC family transcriptional regulator [Eubacteriales bacterium]